MDRLWLGFGAGFGLVGVALGAFGAHALKAQLEPRMLDIFETGVRYQMYHALALVLLAALAGQLPEGPAAWAGRLFVVGIVLFSGSLYLLAISGVTWLGAITPLGGVCFLVAWALLLVAAVRG
ncbi:MAG: DUF423 domain-containing protein [Dehalococcoidia bacterium]|nr:DUF423 domain-containing protein [Dehalococcoidia bacterium]